MEPDLCARCHNQPRAKGHSYCYVCKRARSRLYSTPEWKAERAAKKAAPRLTKRCTRCEQGKSLDDFYQVDGYPYSRCKSCHLEVMREYKEANPDHRRGVSRRSRRKQLLQTYGITEDEYAEMHAQQEGRCAICLEETDLQVDHCHAAGHVRGLLCGRCNKALGLFDDDPARLQAAILYLTTAPR